MLRYQSVFGVNRFKFHIYNLTIKDFLVELTIATTTTKNLNDLFFFLFFKLGGLIILNIKETKSRTIKTGNGTHQGHW